jgi:cell shape-determining protein MreC
VVTSAGLVGEVSAISGRSAKIELVTDAAFRAAGETSISDITGELNGTGGGHLVFESAASTGINPNNRVLYVGSRTVTVGYVTTIEGNKVQLRPAAPFIAGEPVTIVDGN